MITVIWLQLWSSKSACPLWWELFKLPSGYCCMDCGVWSLGKDAAASHAALTTWHVTLPAGSELSALMTFMLQLGFRRPGQPFPLQDLSSFEAGIAAHLAQLGLLLPFRWAAMLVSRQPYQQKACFHKPHQGRACCWHPATASACVCTTDQSPHSHSALAGNVSAYHVLLSHFTNFLRCHALHCACRVDNQVWLCPTRLALALSGGQSAEVQREVAAGFVVVETNFRVGASFFAAHPPTSACGAMHCNTGILACTCCLPCQPGKLLWSRAPKPLPPAMSFPARIDELNCSRETLRSVSAHQADCLCSGSGLPAGTCPCHFIYLATANQTGQLPHIPSLVLQHQAPPSKHCTDLLPALQVYAYTTSDLQTAVLKMFTRAECRLPNLYVGLLTRESVTGALNSGITANQVVQYLRQHAHPQVQGRSPMVPEVGPACSAIDCGWLCSARGSTHLHTCTQLLGCFHNTLMLGRDRGQWGFLQGAGSKG